MKKNKEDCSLLVLRMASLVMKLLYLKNHDKFLQMLRGGGHGARREGIRAALARGGRERRRRLVEGGSGGGSLRRTSSRRPPCATAAARRRRWLDEEDGRRRLDEAEEWLRRWRHERDGGGSTKRRSSGGHTRSRRLGDKAMDPVAPRHARGASSGAEACARWIWLRRVGEGGAAVADFGGEAEVLRGWREH
uniref:Uncharacterized protein n=1 Tax=Oryza sativa subsp. japonica TaxID=39947 RepID=Q75J32_ORYSJ|nr:hypothetical protein [Oryza sativa Japonica Group]